MASKGEMGGIAKGGANVGKEVAEAEIQSLKRKQAAGEIDKDKPLYGQTTAGKIEAAAETVSDLAKTAREKGVTAAVVKGGDMAGKSIADSEYEKLKRQQAAGKISKDTPLYTQTLAYKLD